MTMHESPEVHKQKPRSGTIETAREAGKPIEVGKDRVGVSPKEAAIAEKTKRASDLRKTWQEKFNVFMELRKAHEEELNVMARLKLAGKLNLSDEDMLMSERSGREKVEAAGRDAQKYLYDAQELEKEVVALKGEREEDSN